MAPALRRPEPILSKTSGPAQDLGVHSESRRGKPRAMPLGLFLHPLVEDSSVRQESSAMSAWMGLKETHNSIVNAGLFGVGRSARVRLIVIDA